MISEANLLPGAKHAASSTNHLENATEAKHNYTTTNKTQNLINST